MIYTKKINNLGEINIYKVMESDEVKRAGANGTRGPIRGTAHGKKIRYK